MSTLFFGRDFRLEIYPNGPYSEGYAIVPPMNIKFNVRHSRGKTGGDHMVIVYNLSRDQIRDLRAGSFLALYAGYASSPGGIKLIASGDIVKNGIDHNRDSPDAAITLRFKSGFRAITRLVRGSWRAGTPVLTVYSDITGQVAQAVGEKENKFGPSLSAAYDPLVGKKLTSAFVTAGTFGDALTDLAKVTELEPIENDGLFTLTDQQVTGSSVWPKLSQKDRTLFGVPRITEEGLRVMTFLDGGLRPGQAVVVEHQDFQGDFVITDTEFYGDTGFDSDYNSNLILKRI